MFSGVFQILYSDIMKMGKFTIAPDGRLVYQSNGNIVKGAVNYGINRNDIKARGYTVIDNRVYRNGRLAGYVTRLDRLPKSKRDAITKRARVRQKRAENKAIKEAYQDQTFRHDNSYHSYADAKRMMDNYHKAPGNYEITLTPIELKREEQTNLNFASLLECAVKRGVCDTDGASKAWFDFINGDDVVKSKLWNDLNR